MTGVRNTVPHDLELRLLELYIFGKNYNQIASELDISLNVVTDTRKKFNLPSRRELKFVDRKRFTQMWNDDNMTLVDICNELSMSLDQAFDLAKKIRINT